MRAFRRPTGATLNRRTLLAFLPVSTWGRKGANTKRRVLAATAQSKPASFAPRYEHGAKLSRNKKRRSVATHRQATDRGPDEQHGCWASGSPVAVSFRRSRWRQSRS